MRVLRAAVLLMCGAMGASAHADAHVSSEIKRMLKTNASGHSPEGDGNVRPNRSDMNCFTCSDQSAAQVFRKELANQSEQWNRSVRTTPYGMMVTRQGTDTGSLPSMHPEMPRWVVMNARHTVHSTDIYTRTDQGFDFFKGDDEDGYQMEGMYLIATLASQCTDPTLTICSKFAPPHTAHNNEDSDPDAPPSPPSMFPHTLEALHFHVPVKEWALMIDVDRVVVGEEVCNKICTMEYAPVCGSDNNTYPNRCAFDVAKCKAQAELRIVHEGECGGEKSLEFLA